MTGSVLVVTLLCWVTLLWAHLGGLGAGLWHDEIITVEQFVRGGPRAIFAGEYSLNNHMLFSLFGWFSTALTGESEIIFRYWSVVPGLLAVALGTWWASRSGSRAAGLTALVLITSQAMHVAIVRQGRGYGLAALWVLLTLLAAWKALEPDAPRRMLWLVGVPALLAIFTLPVTVLVLISLIPLLWMRDRAGSIRLTLVVGGVSLLWYARHLRGLVAGMGQDFGEALPWHGPITGPLRYLLFPILRLAQPGYDDPIRHHPYPLSAWVVAWVIFGLLLVSLGIRFWNRRGSTTQALVLVVPVFGSFLALTVSRSGLNERFVSYLVVPMLLLVAGGVAEGASIVSARLRSSRELIWVAGTFCAVLLVGLVVPTYQRLVTTPIEAFKEVAEVIGDDTAPVLTNSLRPEGLHFYVGQVSILTNEDLERAMCSSTEQPFYVIDHPYRQRRPLDTSCLSQAGVRPVVFEQLVRGDRIAVWHVEP